ncbi:hypothetical protein H1R20_g7783, partial [Candolleomyces eurysporus]
MSGMKEHFEQDEKTLEVVDVQSVEGGVYKDRWTRRLLRYGVEDRGVQPVPVEQRIDTQYHKLFFIFFSWNINILTFSAGTLGPVVFGLGLRDTCLAILFFNLLCCSFPAYFVTWGPKLGMRQMIVSRYSFGYYGVIVPCVFNLISMIGYSILSAIVGGQALASVTSNLSWSVGIVAISVISLLVSFGGYNALNWWAFYGYIAALLLTDCVSPPPAEPATAASVLSFASTLAGFAITFSGLSSDYSTYYRSDVSPWRIFWYSYIGLLVPLITLQSLGAAIAVAAPSVPEWEQGYAGGDVGGLLEAMLHPTKGFGKFLTVLLSLSVVGNIASCCYSISINLQVFIPWLVVVPRYVFSVLAIAMYVCFNDPISTSYLDFVADCPAPISLSLYSVSSHYPSSALINSTTPSQTSKG